MLMENLLPNKLKRHKESLIHNTLFLFSKIRKIALPQILILKTKKVRKILK